MVVFSPDARQDVFDLYGYIFVDEPAAADRVMDRISAALALLDEQKVEGREAVLRSGKRVRLWLVSPYRLYYRRQGKVLQVVRVYHEARRPIER
jgi:toxin ParE1/3/4